ncbi:MAG: 3-oxoacyl-ACP synthase III [Planctomycetota bacterium]|nr:3-oxoacyl-ACP synthase III [Planctomycetota bacterium]
MHYQNVCLETLGYTIPDEVVTSAAIEERLHPLYSRLKLSPGRLELITGVRERRFWQEGTLPSEVSIESCQKAISDSRIPIEKIGALIHGSVCRDHLEPATACRVHHGVGLRSDCTIYDTSNACLGILNGILQAANMIELGQVEAALVVGTEGSRQLVEATIDSLNRDEALTRHSIKSAIASLTIGSASCAVLLTHRDISQTQNRIHTATTFANTRFHELCHSGKDEAAADGMAPLMTTDSETLMREGIMTGKETFHQFLEQTGWKIGDIDKSFCHQVGTTHRKLMLESLGMSPEIDFLTVDWLGNTGSAALPTTLAIGLENGFVTAKDHVALLGIGSGINCLMMGIDFETVPDRANLKKPHFCSKPQAEEPNPRSLKPKTAQTPTKTVV